MYLFKGSASSAVLGVIRESSSRVSSSWSYCNTAQCKLLVMAFQSSHESNVLMPTTRTCTWNLSWVPLIFMRELRHSPTTMPIRLIRSTLLSRWLCMPPSMHWSKSEKRERRAESNNLNYPLFFFLFLCWFTEWFEASNIVICTWT